MSDACVSVSAAVDPREWDAFVASHPFASGYHHWGWRRVFQEAFGHSCDYLIAHVDGQAAGVLPLVHLRSWLFGRFTVSLPFLNYGGVVASDRPVAAALLRHASELASRVGSRHLELRHSERVFADLPARQHKVAMLLRLAANAGAMWDGFDRKVRNQIRKAEKNGLTSERGGSERLAEFYQVFTENMRDLGTPVYSRRFFQAILETFPDRTGVVLVRQEGRAVAGAITFRHRGTIEVPWAASLKEVRPLCANHLLYWTIIQDAIEAGATTLDFGRSTPDEGTFHFKAQWGAAALPLFWEYHLVNCDAVPDQSPKNPRFRLAIQTWKRLPLRVTQLVGPPIVRGIP